MPRKSRPMQSKGLETKLTALEEGLKSAISANDRAKRAFENLVAHGYDADRLMIHLMLWARSPEVLYNNSLPARRTLRACGVVNEPGGPLQTKIRIRQALGRVGAP
jgi:hypothetical protein